MSPRAYAVIYDGDCRICGRIVRLLGKWDTRQELEIIPSSAPGVRERFRWISPREYSESIQLVRIGDGKTVRGAAALEELLRILPRGRTIAWLFKVPFARAAAERFYVWFARNRYRLGCGEHCRNG